MASTHLLRRTIVVNEGDSPLTYKPPNYTPITRNVSYFNANGYELKKKVEIWDGSTGKNMEPLCKCILQFQNCVEDWQINQGRSKKNLFKQFLDPTIQVTYQGICENLGNTNADFTESVNRLICEYTGENPKFQANTYLFEDSAHIRKRHDTEVGIHANRLKSLFIFHDMLPGICSNVNDHNNPEQIRKRKLALFKSFPFDWQDEFIKVKNDPANDDTLAWNDIVTWMSTKKRTVDRKKLLNDSLHRQARPGDRTGGRGPPSRRSIGGRGHGRTSYGYHPYQRTQNYSGNNYQGNYQGFFRGNNNGYPQNQGQQGRFPPRNPYNGGRSRGFNGQRNQGFQNNRYQGGRNNQGRSQPQQQQQRQQFLAESHYNQGAESFAAEGSVPEWNQDGMSSGGMPSAEQDQQSYYQAEESQQGHWNDQFNYDEEYYYPDQQEHFSYEDSPFSFDDSSYHGSGNQN
jgi:hypothetical protein